MQNVASLAKNYCCPGWAEENVHHWPRQNVVLLCCVLRSQVKLFVGPFNFHEAILGIHLKFASLVVSFPIPSDPLPHLKYLAKKTLSAIV